MTMHPTLLDLRRRVASTLAPGDAGYEERRRIFNGMIDRRPALIVQPRNDADVIRTVAAARATGMDLAIRGGGHNVAGNSLCDGGIVIDFHHMSDVSVDAVQRRAIVLPGATWGAVDVATAKHGLAVPGGIISDTGVAGLTLGGGVGWLMGVHGLTCDNLLAVRLVLASGDVVTASEKEHSDLFWGVRGGGGNFGVVVEFQFKLHVVRDVYAGAVTYPLTSTRSALRRFIEVGDAAPDELTLSAVLSTADDSRKVIELDACFLGGEEEGRRATAGLASLGGEVSDSRRLQPYVEWQRAFDDPYRRGRRSYWKALYVTRLVDELFDLLDAAMLDVPSPHTMLTFDHLHGAVSRIARNATAFAHRDKCYLLLVNTNWDDPADDQMNVDWTRRLFARLEPFGSSSGYVNYLSDEGTDRVRAAYGDHHFWQLARLKAKYDPQNLFHVNQNIPPAVV